MMGASVLFSFVGLSEFSNSPWTLVGYSFAGGEAAKGRRKKKRNENRRVGCAQLIIASRDRCTGSHAPRVPLEMEILPPFHRPLIAVFVDYFRTRSSFECLSRLPFLFSRGPDRPPVLHKCLSTCASILLRSAKQIRRRRATSSGDVATPLLFIRRARAEIKSTDLRRLSDESIRATKWPLRQTLTRPSSLPIWRDGDLIVTHEKSIATSLLVFFFFNVKLSLEFRARNFAETRRNLAIVRCVHKSIARTEFGNPNANPQSSNRRSMGLARKLNASQCEAREQRRCYHRFPLATSSAKPEKRHRCQRC